MDKMVHRLKVNIFQRAERFIEESGAFAPFGAKIVDKEVKDVVVYDDSDDIDTQRLIDMMQQSFTAEIKNNTALAGAVAYDVTATVNNSDGLPEKRDALCLAYSTDGDNWTEEYFPYLLINDQCVWR